MSCLQMRAATMRRTRQAYQSDADPALSGANAHVCFRRRKKTFICRRIFRNRECPILGGQRSDRHDPVRAFSLVSYADGRDPDGSICRAADPTNSGACLVAGWLRLAWSRLAWSRLARSRLARWLGLAGRCRGGSAGRGASARGLCPAACGVCSLISFPSGVQPKSLRSCRSGDRECAAGGSCGLVTHGVRLWIKGRESPSVEQAWPAPSRFDRAFPPSAVP